MAEQTCVLCGRVKAVHWQTISKPTRFECTGYLYDHRQFTPAPAPPIPSTTAPQEEWQDRCKHGVWASDHCYQCDAAPAPATPPEPRAREQAKARPYKTTAEAWDAGWTHAYLESWESFRRAGLLADDYDEDGSSVVQGLKKARALALAAAEQRNQELEGALRHARTANAILSGEDECSEFQRKRYEDIVKRIDLLLGGGSHEQGGD